MIEPEDTTMKVLKTATCKTLSGKSTLTFQIGLSPDSIVHLRISNNSGKGCFSNEWLAFDEIHDALKKLPKDTPISSYYLAHLFKGKSVNTPSFLLAALKHLKLVLQLPNNRRHHELTDPRPFLEQVEKLIPSRYVTPSTAGSSWSCAAPIRSARRGTSGTRAATRARPGTFASGTSRTCRWRMTLAPNEFMRQRHVRPAGFHRIRHYGLIANTTRKDSLVRARELLMSKEKHESANAEANAGDTADSGNRDASATYVCPDCGAAMIIIENFERGQLPRAPPRQIDAS